VTVFCSGQQRLCLPHTRFQLHQATWEINERVDLRRAQEIVSILESDDQSNAVIVSGATGLPQDEVLAAIKRGTIWMAAEAKNRGLVHDVTIAFPAC